jgi:hypothetical protein
MTDVWPRVDVVNRSRNVELFVHLLISAGKEF